MNDERRTPKDFFNAIEFVFPFSVDAAATSENALVKHYWTKTDDGLKQDWCGHCVWCNPPYSRGQLIKWAQKAPTVGPGTAVMLLPGDSSTAAGQLVLETATAILFVNRRLKFDGESQGAKFASWLAMWGTVTIDDIHNLQHLSLGMIYSRHVLAGVGRGERSERCG